MEGYGLGREFTHSLMDRRPRNYHWQPAHMEDDIEEDLLAQQLELMALGLLSHPEEYLDIEECGLGHGRMHGHGHNHGHGWQQELDCHKRGC